MSLMVTLCHYIVTFLSQHCHIIIHSQSMSFIFTALSIVATTLSKHCHNLVTKLSQYCHDCNCNCNYDCNCWLTDHLLHNTCQCWHSNYAAPNLKGKKRRGSLLTSSQPVALPLLSLGGGNTAGRYLVAWNSLEIHIFRPMWLKWALWTELWASENPPLPVFYDPTKIPDYQYSTILRKSPTTRILPEPPSSAATSSHALFHCFSRLFPPSSWHWRIEDCGREKVSFIVKLNEADWAEKQLHVLFFTRSPT